LLLVGCLSAQPSTLRAEYYNGTEFNQKVTTRIESNIDKAWNDIPPVPGIDPHNCSIRWMGRITAPKTGTYTFSAKVDDGIRVWVGGVLVIDNWNLNDDGQFTGKVIMREGTAYDLKVEYFNALIEGEIRLLWKLPEAQLPAIVESKYFQEQPKPAPPKTLEPQISKPSKPKVETKPQTKTEPKPKPKTEPKPQPSTEPKAESRTTVVAADTLEKYIPKNVFFEQGKSIMLEKSKPGLDNLAGYLLRNPQFKLKIEGHTDIIGDMGMNKTLSEERAKVVAEYLATKGVEEHRLEAKGYGSSRPLVTGNSKKGYPENRRVAFFLQ
jgi:outer membrane protein OmpA-like peptidoglycan-associated protein